MSSPGKRPDTPVDDQLTRGGRLASNALLTLVTGGVLLVASLVVIPFAIHAFGRELFGILAITWMLGAHLVWLDFGLSRASARFVARELAVGERGRGALWAWTALLTQAAIGLPAALVLWLAAPELTAALHVSDARQPIAVLAVRVFALSIPINLATRSMVGVLQAGQRFGWVNANSLVSSFANYGVYAIGILHGDSFRTVVWGLFLVQVGSFVSAFVGATRVVPMFEALRSRHELAHGYGSRLRLMAGFGGWVALASLLGPILAYLDQWVVGFVLGVAILPYYAVPYALLDRLDVISSSLTSTLFPAFSSLEARADWSRIQDYFVRAHRYLMIVTIPILFVIFVWGGQILSWWIGESFAKHATTPLRILVCGELVGLLAPLSGALLQGIGRPGLIAKIYAAEVLPNIVLVFSFTKLFGLTGAASSFTLRTIVETLILWIVVARVVDFDSGSRRLLSISVRRIGGALLVLAAAAALIEPPGQTAVIVTVGLLSAYTLAVALGIFDDRDWALVRSLVRRTSGARAAA